MAKTTCFWSWNSLLSQEEIARQMEDFHEKGYGGVVIHSRCGLRVPYMGDAWFACYEQAMELAQQFGMDAYIYDEDGWPSGFAGGAVPALGEELWYKCLRYGYTRPEKYPLLAAFRQTEAGYRQIMPEEAIEGDLYFWYVPDRHYVDLLNPRTVPLFIENTYETYKKRLGKWFGSVIKGFFTDEPQLSVGGWPWSPCLAEEYERRFGEPLVPEVWRLLDPAETAFRRRFWLFTNDWLVSCFTRPLSAWCRENGVVLTGHFAAEDGLCNQISANGGLLPHYKEMGLPGIDYLGNRQPTPLLMKQPASIAAQFGDGKVLSESFGCSGWGVRFEELLYNWGWQSVLGITRSCLHLAAYTLAGRRKRDYPAFFSYQEPWWEAFPALLAEIDGLNALMTAGERELHTVVVSPLCGAMEVYEAEGERRDALRRISASYRQLLENLLDIQLDFELTDETILHGYGRVEQGSLTVGQRRYTRVYVAEGAALDDATAARLAEFAAQGGRLLCVGSVPPALAALGEYPVVMNRRSLLEKELLAQKASRPARVLEETGQTAGGLVLHLRRTETGRRVHILNRHEGQRRCLLQLEDATGATLVDVATGKRTALPAYVGETGCLTVPLTLSSKQSVVVETAPAAEISTCVWSGTLPLQAEPTFTEPNAFTIDRAAYRLDGGEYSPEVDVITVPEAVYAASCPYERVLQVRYRFTCGEVFSGAELAIEDGPAEITFNGQSLTEKTGWWIDRQIGTYSIAPWLRAGENELVLTYRVPPYEKQVSVDEVFETERNRFCYPVEPEAVYVRGDFAVQPLGRIWREPDYLSVEDSGFLLTAPTPVSYGDLTSQGRWFYRGNVTYTVTVTKAPGQRVVLQVPDYAGTLVGWQVKEAGGYIATGAREADLTEVLEPGENRVTVTLYGSNRNLMGPHHHWNGENIFVGPDTYLGRYGFEDFVSPHIVEGESTYRSRYAFLPLGISRMQVTYYTDDK